MNVVGGVKVESGLTIKQEIAKLKARLEDTDSELSDVDRVRLLNFLDVLENGLGVRK